MSEMTELQASIDEILSGKMTFDQLATFANKGDALERTNAIMQLPRQFPSAESVAVLEAAAQLPRNEIVLMGRTIKAIAIASLLAMKRKDSTDAASRIIETLSGNEIQDLEFHLHSEGLQMPQTRREAQAR